MRLIPTLVAAAILSQITGFAQAPKGSQGRSRNTSGSMMMLPVDQDPTDPVDYYGEIISSTTASDGTLEIYKSGYSEATIR